MDDQEKIPLKMEATELVLIEHPECTRTIQGRKVVLSKKTGKSYRVTIQYIPVTAEEGKIKRAIIEGIMKKGYNK